MKTMDSSFAGADASDRGPALSNGALGMLMLIAMELMFFAALISAFLIISAAAEVWPPAGQPRLPILASAVNSLVLFASGLSCHDVPQAHVDAIQHAFRVPPKPGDLGILIDRRPLTRRWGMKWRTPHVA